jgi:hypothetical protein
MLNSQHTHKGNCEVMNILIIVCVHIYIYQVYWYTLNLYTLNFHYVHLDLDIFYLSVIPQ